MQRAAGETCRIHTVLQKGVSILLFKVRKWGKKDNVKRSGNNSFFVRKIENWFSERLPRMGAKKKLVARILKSEPLILKSKPLIFCPLKTRPAGAGDQWPFRRISVCLRVPKMRTKRRYAPGQPAHKSNKHVNRPDSCRLEKPRDFDPLKTRSKKLLLEADIFGREFFVV